MSFGNIKENKFTSRLFFSAIRTDSGRASRKSNSQKCKRFDPNDYMLFLLRLYVCWISYWLRVKFQNIKFWKCSCPCFTPTSPLFSSLGLLSFPLTSSPRPSLVHFSPFPVSAPSFLLPIPPLPSVMYLRWQPREAAFSFPSPSPRYQDLCPRPVADTPDSMYAPVLQLRAALSSGKTGLACVLTYRSTVNHYRFHCVSSVLPSNCFSFTRIRRKRELTKLYLTWTCVCLI